jgi:hypothetical protein
MEAHWWNQQKNFENSFKKLQNSATKRFLGLSDLHHQLH